jgi:hypothetical protein
MRVGVQSVSGERRGERRGEGAVRWSLEGAVAPSGRRVLSLALPVAA